MNLSSGLEATAQETRFLAGSLSQMPDYQGQFSELKPYSAGKTEFLYNSELRL
jgi:hypothetical protein